jgi:large subunit ribosomal protein L30
MLRIKLVKSPIGNNHKNRATVRALGLRKMNHTVEQQDTPMIRGMIHHVKHMLEVTEVEETSKAAPKAAEKAAPKASAKASAKTADAPAEATVQAPKAKKSSKKAEAPAEQTEENAE